MNDIRVTLIPEKNHSIIVDIDGTIANVDERLGRALEIAGVTTKIVNDKYNFYRDNRRFTFYEELFNPEAMLALDTPIDGAVKKLDMLSKFFTIFYVTSRPKDDDNEDTYDATAKWLENNNFPDGVLLMRPRMQKRCSFVTSAFSELQENGYQLVLAFDDLFDGRAEYEAFGIKVVEIVDESWDIPNICMDKDGAEICIDMGDE